VNVTMEEFKAIRAKMAAKKAKREEKRASMSAYGPKSNKKGPRSVQRLNKRPSARKGLVKRLDAIFSLFIRARDSKLTGGRCVLGCGMIENCAHLITRAKHSVRWDARNATGQCYGANLRHEFDSHPYTAWYIRTNGLEAYETLVRDSNRIAKFSNAELELKLAEIERAYVGLLKNP
jgi:hypothetical protein